MGMGMGMGIGMGYMTETKYGDGDCNTHTESTESTASVYSSLRRIRTEGKEKFQPLTIAAKLHKRGVHVLINVPWHCFDAWRTEYAMLILERRAGVVGHRFRSNASRANLETLETAVTVMEWSSVT
jgi:hypothetical protein